MEYTMRKLCSKGKKILDLYDFKDVNVLDRFCPSIILNNEKQLTPFSKLMIRKLKTNKNSHLVNIKIDKYQTIDIKYCQFNYKRLLTGGQIIVCLAKTSTKIHLCQFLHLRSGQPLMNPVEHNFMAISVYIDIMKPIADMLSLNSYLYNVQ